MKKETRENKFVDILCSDKGWSGFREVANKFKRANTSQVEWIWHMDKEAQFENSVTSVDELDEWQDYWNPNLISNRIRDTNYYRNVEVFFAY